jgi:hypothetical protein
MERTLASAQQVERDAIREVLERQTGLEVETPVFKGTFT